MNTYTKKIGWNALAAAAIWMTCAAQAMAYSWTTLTQTWYTGTWPLQSEHTCTRPALWRSNTIPLYRSNNGFPTASSWYTALTTAWSRWNAGASKVNFAVYADSATTWSSGDGKNSIFFTSDASVLSGAPAITYTVYSQSDCKIDEADLAVAANPATPWTTSENASHLPYSNSSRNIIGTITHELGHVLGLGHENRYYNIMGSDFSHLARTKNSVTFYGPGEDGNNGAAYLFGESTTARPDIGLTVMRYSGTSGEYSTHTFGSILTSSGAVVSQRCPTSPFGQQSCFIVKRGSSYQMQVTVENNGTKVGAPTTIPIKIYICTDNTLATGTLLSSWNVTHSRSVPFQTTFSFTVPSSTPLNVYRYVAAYYLPPSGTADQVGNNNIAIIPVYIN